MKLLPCVSAAYLWCAATVSIAAPACDEAALKLATTPAPPPLPELVADSEKRIANVPAKVDVMTVGDSITNGWPLESLQAVFPGKKIYNFGIHGDLTQNVLWRLQSPEMKKVRPPEVTLLIGTNNLSFSAPPCAVVAGTKAIIEKIDELWGKPKLRVIEILPRGDGFSFRDADRKAVNSGVEEIVARRGNATAINADREIACGFKQPCGNYLPDNLHLTLSGYAVLQAAIAGTK